MDLKSISKTDSLSFSVEHLRVFISSFARSATPACAVRVWPFSGLLLIFCLSSSNGFGNVQLDAVVEEVHAASLRQRTKVLSEAVQKETLWPAPGHKAWGDVMWALSLLYLNERVDDANERIRELGQTDEPFAYFGAADYVRILTLFNSQSAHYPGRLEPETEEMMKTKLWEWVLEFEEHWEPFRDKDREKEGSIWSVYASENHDLIRKGNNYIILSVLAQDPAYSGQRSSGGHTVTELRDLYATYFKKWLKERAATGLWMEVGSEYAKYSYGIIFNLFDLSPDPELRRLAGMFLDLAFIEEAQMSFKDGFRGGGKSRPPRDNPENVPGMVQHKQLLYGQKGHGSHSRTFETSQYQVPDIAILLRKYGDTAPPFLIRNRVIGETEAPSEAGVGVGYLQTGDTFYMAADSAMINYCWKTPEYMIGSTLLLLDDSDDGFDDDSGITRQDRWSGVVFNDGNHSRVTPWGEVSRPSGSRIHNAYWQVQHENLLVTQKMMRSRYMERLLVYFSPTLKRTESDGWVFAATANAWVAVNVIGGYSWGTASHGKWPNVTFLVPNDEYAPIIFFAGSKADGFASYEAFQQHVLTRIGLEKRGKKLTIEQPGKVDVEFYTNYRSPKIDDPDRLNPYHNDLKTDYTYDSPYLKTGKNRYQVWARWGDEKRLYDFEAGLIKGGDDAASK